MFLLVSFWTLNKLSYLTYKRRNWTSIRRSCTMSYKRLTFNSGHVCTGNFNCWLSEYLACWSNLKDSILLSQSLFCGQYSHNNIAKQTSFLMIQTLIMNRLYKKKLELTDKTQNNNFPMSFDYEYIGSKYIKYQIYPNFTKFLQLLGIYSRRLSARSVSNFLSLSKKIGLTHLSNHSAFPFSLNWGNHSLSRVFVKETFTFYLAPPWPTLGHYWVDSLTHPMLITALLQCHLKVTGSPATRMDQ